MKTKTFLETTLALGVVTFNTLLILLTAFVIGSSGFLLIILFINMGYEINNIIFAFIILWPFVPAMTVPAKIIKVIPNWFDFLVI